MPRDRIAEAEDAARRREKVKEKYVAVLVWKVPRVLKGRFKATCYENGVTMRECIQQLMERYVIVKTVENRADFDKRSFPI